MEQYRDQFALIGLCTCIYAIARLMHYFSLTLQDKNPKGSFASTFLTCVSFILWVLSFPVTLVLTFLNKLHNDRAYEIIRKDESAPLKERIRRLEDELSTAKNGSSPRRAYYDDPLVTVTTFNGSFTTLHESQIPAFLTQQQKLKAEYLSSYSATTKNLFITLKDLTVALLNEFNSTINFDAFLFLSFAIMHSSATLSRKPLLIEKIGCDLIWFASKEYPPDKPPTESVSAIQARYSNLFIDERWRCHDKWSFADSVNYHLFEDRDYSEDASSKIVTCFDKFNYCVNSESTPVP